MTLTEAQVVALEKAKVGNEVESLKASDPASWGPSTCYMKRLKGVGQFYKQTFIDTHRMIGFAKVYDWKMLGPLADLLNDRGLPLFEQQEILLN